MYMSSAGVPGAAASLEAGRLSVQFSSVQLFSRVQLFAVLVVVMKREVTMTAGDGDDG